ncbi:LLM class flavin-dependent oxidoreductase [Nocardia pseudobrasiliensis]|uniref:Alkanesulfonate monooxygenase SsuD/methylene tetrahydromethanopterin reductase-like flavin-dependent oxidoreductase (Luciferase family) n=1 Tax=Nocardia pseudobrasiliensis TaxID=45979 RepID=A0A370HZI9_9NOCA|nr:LLM class flavin-dependent oxidoreductase [Nocardia pseudobrasiliensis]RDI63888.1 alkanesulfonate monooxygenase SsuD/methylene tetrahydromethanopterin reductase-like flavin-dependent oxidoreductase (luciferase family) [Nocardia pseudobrasiliensis]
MPISLGVSLPTVPSPGAMIGDIPALARHVEQLGLDAMWTADYLSPRGALLESTVALAAAAAVTTRVRLGFGVMLLALRQQAWAARQLGSLQYLSGNRIMLGVGTGVHRHEWSAAGSPFADRGRRTDLMLSALPDLLAGRPTALLTEPGAPTVTLEPAVPMPEIWVGGMSDRALRRVVEHGAGWLASLLTPAELATRAGALETMAADAGAPMPELATTVFAALGADAERRGRERVVRFLCGLTGLAESRVSPLVISGSPEKLAERLDDYLRAGARTFVVNLSGPDLPGQYDLLARTRELLG